jgi:hypothetical protein
MRVDVAQRPRGREPRSGRRYNPTPYESFPSRRPQLVGSSLALVGLSNLLLVVIAVNVGLHPIGLISLACLGLVSWMLILAEILSVQRFGE